MTYIAEADIMTTTQLLVTAIVGLSTAIGVMWLFFQKKFARAEQKLDACEARHEVSNTRMLDQAESHTTQIVNFAEQVGELRGEINVLKEQLTHKRDS